jgi:hypothetical protein
MLTHKERGRGPVTGNTAGRGPVASWCGLSLTALTLRTTNVSCHNPRSCSPVRRVCSCRKYIASFMCLCFVQRLTLCDVIETLLGCAHTCDHDHSAYERSHVDVDCVLWHIIARSSMMHAGAILPSADVCRRRVLPLLPNILKTGHVPMCYCPMHGHGCCRSLGCTALQDGREPGAEPARVLCT